MGDVTAGGQKRAKVCKKDSQKRTKACKKRRPDAYLLWRGRTLNWRRTLPAPPPRSPPHPILEAPPRSVPG
eukprot:2879920-Rhodomonas_salina.1